MVVIATGTVNRPASSPLINPAIFSPVTRMLHALSYIYYRRPIFMLSASSIRIYISWLSSPFTPL